MENFDGFDLNIYKLRRLSEPAELTCFKITYLDKLRERLASSRYSRWFE